MSVNIGTIPNLWDYFSQISAIPRPSQKEEKIRKWILGWAKQHGFASRTDAVGNVIIMVPPHRCSHSQSVVLQAHMDMVCEKEDWSDHNFDTDAIQLCVDGDWIRANGTTLGSDNGIGLALAMAAATDNASARPPLILLFTVDEESGLTGASQLKADQLDSNYLINLDSEDDATIIVGCAGGQNLHISLQQQHMVPIEQVYNQYIGCKIIFRGYAGGHSGVDIAEPVGNPILDAARYIECCNKDILSRRHSDFHIVELSGGTVHNAIPRAAETVVFIPQHCFSDISNYADVFQKQLSQQYREGASTPEIVVQQMEMAKTQYTKCYNPQQSLDIISMLIKLPQGVFQFLDDSAIPFLSSNVATVNVNHAASDILMSFRGLEDAPLKQYVASIASSIANTQFNIDMAGYYPPWSPQFTSELLDWAQTSYKTVLGVEPKVEVIHAGLETAVIAATYPNMQMISCGPLLLNPHSPAECLNIKSTERTYQFLQELLRTIASALK